MDNLSQYKSDPWVHVYIFFNAFLVAGFTEEMIKAFILQHCVKIYLPHKNMLNANYIISYVWLGLFVGLGFGTMEGVIYTCVYGMGTGLGGQAILWAVRVFLAIPFHTTTGFIWGIQLSKRDCLKYNYNWFKLSWIQIMWHGSYDFGEMEYSLFESNANVGIQLLGILLGYIILFIAAYLAYKDFKNIYPGRENPLLGNGINVNNNNNNNVLINMSFPNQNVSYARIDHDDHEDSIVDNTA